MKKNNKSFFKRRNCIKLISILLIVCMSISVFPGTVLATTENTPIAEGADKEITATTENKASDEILDPIIISEDVTKRGEKEKHFLCDDGSYIAVSYPHAVHEQVNGEWVDIEYDVTDDKGEISPVDEDIKVKFANNTNSAKLVKLETGKYKISWTVEAETEDGNGVEKVKLSKESKAAIKTNKEITKAKKDKIKNSAKHTTEEVFDIKQKAKKEVEQLKLAKTANLEENTTVISANAAIQSYNCDQIQSVAFAQSNVEYAGAFGEGTTLRYLMTPGKINEEIVLDSYNGFKSYSMIINTDGLTPIANEFGRVELVDKNGNVMMTIAAPYMYDSVDVVSEDIEVTVTQENKKEWRITYTPDAEWLLDKDRVYPVVIDPVVTTKYYAQVDQLDTYVRAGQTYAYNDSGPTLYVGYYGGENWTYWGVETLPGLNEVTNISGVSFNIKLQGGTTTMGNIELYDIGTTALNTATMMWSNKPELGTKRGEISTVPGDLWLRYSTNELGNLLRAYYRTHWSNLGFALKYKTYINDWNQFYSSDYTVNNNASIPYLEVRYTTTFQTPVEGTYYIQNVNTGKYLASSGSSVYLSDYGAGGTAVQWTLQRYSYYPDSYNIVPSGNTSLGLYFDMDYGTITLPAKAGDGFGRWYFEMMDNGSYLILSAGRPWMSLTGSGTSVYPSGTNTGSSQQWILTPKSEIYPQSKNLYIGDTYDLDNVSIFPSSTNLSWSIVSGSQYVNYDSTTNKILAKRAGTAVFDTTLSNGVSFQFTITVLESRPIENGLYYIKNIFSGKYIDIDNPNSANVNKNLKQMSIDYAASSQVWEIKYNTSEGYYMISSTHYNNVGNYMAVLSNSEEYIQTQMLNSSSIASGWALIPTDASNVYNIISINNPSKVLGIYPENDANGSNIVSCPRNIESNSQKWEIFKAENRSAILAENVNIGDTKTLYIPNESAFKWYKITVPASDTKALRVILESPEIEELITEDDSQHARHFISIYSGTQDNPTVLEGVTRTKYSRDECTIGCDDFTGTKTFYIKISSCKEHGYISNDSLQISFLFTSQLFGNEVVGWKALDNYVVPTFSYFLDNTMYEYQVTEEMNGITETYTYGELFQEAINLWNDVDVKGDGTPMFQITTDTTGYYARIYVEELDSSAAGVNYSANNNIVLNSKFTTEFSKNAIIELMCHELGHSVGLADLYVTKEHGYYYNGEIVDNKDHLMYGMGAESANSQIVFHEDDKIGARTLHNWYSFVEYNIEDLYNESDYIVKGKVKYTEVYKENTRYTRIYFEVEDYIYNFDNNVSNIISFLHLGNLETDFIVNPLYKEDEQYILYLHFDLYNELFVVGGPQGRFIVEDCENESKVTNQLDRYIEKTMEKKIGQKKEFSKNSEEFIAQAKLKTKIVKK